ncbi:MAG: alpha-2-macroglobulin [Planctomycetota bacterium]
MATETVAPRVARPALKPVWILGAALMALNAAGIVWIRASLVDPTPSRVRILSVRPDGLRHADRIGVVFNQELASPTQVGHVLASAPLRIEPPLAGDWVWDAPDRLELRLTEPVPPGRRYQLRPVADADLWREHRLYGETTIALDSGALRVVACSLDAVETQQTFFTIGFDQPVHPSDLQRHITVHVDEAREPSAVRVLGSGPATIHVLEIPGSVMSGFEVLVSAELVGHGAELPLGTRARREIRLPKQLALTTNDPFPASLRAAAGVRIDFSERLDSSQPLPHFTVTPAVADFHAGYEYGDVAVRGDFIPGQVYRLTIPAAGLVAVSGATFSEPQTTWFEVPEPHPEVAFRWSRGFLSPLGNLELPVRALNTRELEITATRIHDNNLIPHLGGGNDLATGRALFETTVDLGVAAVDREEVVLDLRKLLAPARGIYRVSARARQRYWARDDAVIAITDLAITAKRGATETLAWVTSLRSGHPRLGVRVSAWSRNNQKLAEAVTDFDGVARLRLDPASPDGAAWVLVAESEDDRSYVLLDRHRWPAATTPTAGRVEPSTYDAHIYCERGVYRPGDTLHLTGILRDATGHVPPSFPLWVRVRRPDGRVVAELPAGPTEEQAHALDDGGGEARARQGVFHAEFVSDAADLTGRYRFEVTLPGSDQVLGETTALIEAFAPVRLEVECHSERALYEPGEGATLSIAARYLAGAPARALPLVVTVDLHPAPLLAPDLPGFHFGPSAPTVGSTPKPGAALQRTSTTDARGAAELILESTVFPLAGRWEAHVSATVTELGGRSVTGHSTFIADTSGRHIGLRLASGGFAPSGVPVALEWAAVDTHGHAVSPGTFELEVIRREHEWQLEEVNGRAVWRTLTHDTSLRRESITTERARGTTPITFPDPGEYRVRVTAGPGHGYTELTLWAGYGQGLAGAANALGPDHVDVELESPRVAAGAVANVRVRSPFRGNLLVTLESHRVHHYQVVSLTSESTELAIPVPADLRGGAFVVASVVRAIDPTSDSWLPHRATGIARLVVDHDDRVLPVVLEAASRVEPDSELTVTVRAPAASDPSRPGLVHLWAVDAGILLADRYATPDPHRHFFAPRRLAISSSDPFGDLLPDLRLAASLTRIGGDGSMDPEQLRRGPIEVEQREANVVWRRAVALDERGMARIALEIPDMNGELRLLAVVVDGDRYGAAEHAVTVAADLVALPSWPRFVAPDDTFQVPVRVLNHTAEAVAVQLAVEVRGPLDLAPLPAEPLLVPASGSAVATFAARALAPGRVEITTQVIGPESVTAAHDVSVFTVRPVTSLHRETRFARIPAGESLALAPTTSFFPETVHTEVSVGALPTVELRPALEQVIDYPYGCVEQTTSRLLAMLHVPELLTTLDGAIRSAEIERRILAGVARLHRMTTAGGGLAYWPGEAAPHRWGSAYAALTLAQAQRLGYTVEESLRRDLNQYLRKELNGNLSDNQRAMICHATAALGDLDLGWANALDLRRAQLDPEGRAHLIGAWWEAGRLERARAALDDATLGDGIVLDTGARITSATRQDSVLLGVLLDVAPTHEWIPALVSRLERTRRTGAWCSTLDNASALAALSRYQTLQAASASANAFSGTLTSRGGFEQSFDSQSPTVAKLLPPASEFTLRTEGQGVVYVAATFTGLVSHGAPAAYDRGLEVRRVWRDAEGRVLDPDTPLTLTVGDLVHVEIGLEASTWIDHIAIVDALPGGCEVENPRLATSATFAPRGTAGSGARDTGRGTAADAPQRVEFLDDRVVLFCSAGRERKAFGYALRVTGIGSFVIPPIQASCMYDEAIASLHGGGKLEVR